MLCLANSKVDIIYWRDVSLMDNPASFIQGNLTHEELFAELRVKF